MGFSSNVDSDSPRSNLRHLVATEAARILYRREFKEYYQAKREAARRQATTVLPTNQEIHRQLLLIADAVEGPERTARLHSMRTAALEVMERLERFRPRLIGSVWTGHIRAGSDIDLHLYSNALHDLETCLQLHHMDYSVYRVQSKQGQALREFVHVKHRHPLGYDVEMTLYTEEEFHDHPLCSITGGPMARADVARLKQVVHRGEVGLVCEIAGGVDQEFQALLADSGRWSELMENFPELSACRNVAQNHPHHDVFEHTVEVCRNLLRLRREPEPYTLAGRARPELLNHLRRPGPGGWARENLLMLAGFCHDLGKPLTRSVLPSGRIRFVDHEAVGAGAARRVAERWGVAKETVSALERMVGLHMVPVRLSSRSTLPSMIYRFFREAGDLAPELLLLSWADVAASRDEAQGFYRLEEQSTFVEEMLGVFFQRGFLRFPTLPVSEIDLETEFGLSEPEMRSRLLERLLYEYLDGEFQGREDGLELAAGLLDCDPDLW